MVLFVCIALILVLGLAQALLMGIYGSGLFVTDWLNRVGDFTVNLVVQLADLPFSGIHVQSPPVVVLWCFYLLAGWAGYYTLRKVRPPVWLRYGLAGCLLAWPVWAWGESLRSELRWTTLAVGHGCANVVELSDGKTIVFDAGSMSDFNVGQRTIAPYLRSRGIDRIDGLFLSHPDVDHFNGAVDLCRQF